MKAIVIATVMLASLAAATAFSLDRESIKVTSAVARSMQPVHPTEPHPGYVAYPDYDVAAPGPGCYWTRLPVYDTARNRIGWLGRPVAVCPAGSGGA
jgi:hypothetical protein